jgi:argininosuccinate lyase
MTAVQRPSPSGRLKSGPAPALIRSANQLEVSYGPVLYQGMSLADLAHVIMMMEMDVIPGPAGQELLAVLLEADAIPTDEFPFDPSLGDAYKSREHYVNSRSPNAGGWLRAGRARREVTNIAYRLAVRQRLLTLLGVLNHLAEVVVARAEEHIDTLMPDYTYLQQAQPTTLGHYLLGFVYPMLRDSDRLQACFGHINRCPGGIGSVNGSRLPINRQRVAELLGFDGAIHHTRDAMWQADTPIEVTAAAVALLINLDRLAEDLQVWVTQEFNMVDLADGYTRTSVIMPQKKNPYSLTYVRGLANVTIGQLVAMANVGRTPSGQPDNRIFAYGSVPNLLDRTIEAVQLMAEVLDTLGVNTALMARRAGLGFSQATDLADAIMLATKLPYQTAHRIVGQLVTAALDAGVPAEDISSEMIDQAAQAIVGQSLNLPPKLLAEVLDPRAIVATRTGLGGAADKPMRAMFAECREQLARVEDWRLETEQRLAAAQSSLVRRARQLGGPLPGPIKST